MSCYCGDENMEEYMFQCSLCQGLFHPKCLKCGVPSPLSGDVYFKFVCCACSETGDEVCTRSKLLWSQVIRLALHNLSLRGPGRNGYFRWKEHICAFISKHWDTLFGMNRRRTNTWHGTVSGTLSSGCPELFLSGQVQFEEPGWWKLNTDRGQGSMSLTKPCQERSLILADGLRSRKCKSSFQAAVEIKRKRDSTVDAKTIRSQDKAKNAQTTPDLPVGTSPVHKEAGVSPSQSPRVKVERGNATGNTCVSSAVESLVLIDSSIDSDLDPDNLSPEDRNSPITLDYGSDVGDLLSTLGDCGGDQPSVSRETLGADRDITSGDESSREIKVEPSDEDSDSASEASEESSESDESQFNETNQAMLAVVEKMHEEPDEKYVPMSLYEERKLLNLLNSKLGGTTVDPKLVRLRQKLKLRQIKREKGLPIFDLDAIIARSLQASPDRRGVSHVRNPEHLPERQSGHVDFRVLDRFQTSRHVPNYRTICQSASFLNRLVGTDEDSLTSIVSPYTERVLKPFIRRDYESKSLKMKLYGEIISYPYRNDPNSTPPTLAPIDYSYVRPQHIASVNAMSREFFWPGIDMSESLHYPDFSCIALYKKIVIGFAFMVPDVKYNEAYISFILTHPEWRNCGIGTFMLYHLIQTCRGKDITLHVSATSPAMLLYQKFGFKPEEFILDFYDKYYPAESKACKHAFFLRLKR